MGGRFITFEGPEGSGKSTQVERLADRLRDRGLDIVCTREPGGTATGDLIRGILQHDTAGEALQTETEVLLFAASRAQLVQTVILPVLQRGGWVLCDRFLDSTLAYQSYARGVAYDTVRNINAYAIGSLEPDLTLLLDLPVEESLARMAHRNSREGREDDRFEREKTGFHQRVRDGFLDIARREPGRVRILDATQTIDSVHEQVWEAVSSLLESSS